MAGIQDVSPGAALNASTVDEIAKQATPQYANAAARDADATLTAALREGLTVRLLDSNTLTVYTGSAWSTQGPDYGALKAWAPALTQGVGVTIANGASAYRRSGRWIEGWFYITATSAGTAANDITISLPVTASGSVPAGLPIGQISIIDASGPTTHDDTAKVMTTTTMGPYANATNRGNTVGPLTLASGDVLWGTFSYEAAADA